MELVIIGMGKFGSALSNAYKMKGAVVHEVSRETPSESIPKDASILICVPTQEIPNVLKQRKALLSAARCVISTVKGIIRKEGLTATVFLHKHLRKSVVLTLSGPSFASEIKAGHPIALVLGGKNRSAVEKMADALSTPRIRIYKSHDPLGVELSGALKNVYAIAAGATEGLGFGTSTRAALTSRALAEMCRVGTALGGKTFTFFGLAGAGDLFLTCSSRLSRNYRFGLGLASGQSTEELLKCLGTVEGAWTAEVAHKLCQRAAVRSPLIDAVVDLIDGKSPNDVFSRLMHRKIRHEFE